MKENLSKKKYKYIKSKISSINNSNYDLDAQGVALFHSVQYLKDYIDEFFKQRLKNNRHFRNELLIEFRSRNYTKARIIDLSNAFLIRKSVLEKYLGIEVLLEIKTLINFDEYITYCLQHFKDKIQEDRKFNYLKKNIQDTLRGQFDFIFTKGFSENSLRINSGVMTANAGDSAQFLFISRAILLGFNCSNVDVRSSRYDAIIDFNGTLLRIQIKGLSNDKISFKDRDRGGQGIDYTHNRNRGKRVSSKECDLYVGVDRRFGTCYLIPVEKYIDKLDEEEILKSINVSKITKYKENWSIIKMLANKSKL